ncbi:MAG: sugar-binding transcriptional regulator [Christensenella sp.]|nr:sugar-binding transcriptional regulator [Christensenella sp.]
MGFTADERYDLKIKIAHLYYMEDKTQAEISKMLSISRPTIVKMLQEAKDEKIVHIQISEPRLSNIFLKDEIALRHLLGVEDVKIVNVPSDNPDILCDRIGATAANYLLNILKSGNHIGLGWGKTLRYFAEKIKFTSKTKDLRVYPLVGGLGTSEDALLSSNKLSETFVGNFPKSTVRYLYAPIIASDILTARAFLDSKPIRSLFEEATSMDIAVVNISGDPEHSMMIETSMASDSESFSQADLEELKAQNAVGSICGHFYNIDGKLCNTSLERRVISIDAATLKNVPMVIAAAGGKHKVDAIIGAARGRLFNVLITDEYTAHELLEYLRNQY